MKFLYKQVAILTIFAVIFTFYLFHMLHHTRHPRRVKRHLTPSFDQESPGLKDNDDSYQKKQPDDKKQKAHETDSQHIDKKKYFYGHNITDTRKDYDGHSYFPHLNYHIGVVSASKFLKSRAKDLYHTWGKEAKSISIYLGAHGVAYNGELPITQLPDVNDTVYPPQKKSFKLIKYWCDHLLHQYDWFVKVDDDTYVKMAPLEDFLWSLDETKKYYIGRPGSGLKHEKHLLGLGGNTFCCGPTVIYSQPLLKEICPHIDNCLSEVITPHEDTEIGRCMLRKLGMQCADNQANIPVGRSLRRMFYQTYDPGHFMGDLTDDTLVKNAITLHEVKHSDDMYNLHYYYRLWMSMEKNTRHNHKSNHWKIIHKTPKYKQQTKP